MKFKISQLLTGSKTVIIKYRNQENNAIVYKAFQASLKKNRLIADIRLNNEQFSISYWKMVAAICGTIPLSEVITNKRGRNSNCSVLFKNGNPEDCRPENLIVNYNGEVFTELYFPSKDKEVNTLINTENN